MLATETLRSALERRGCACPDSHVELRLVAGHQFLVVAFVDPEDPWQVTLGALADVIGVVRTFDPSVRLADGRLEPIDTDQPTRSA